MEEARGSSGTASHLEGGRQHFSIPPTPGEEQYSEKRVPTQEVGAHFPGPEWRVRSRCDWLGTQRLCWPSARLSLGMGSKQKGNLGEQTQRTPLGQGDDNQEMGGNMCRPHFCSQEDVRILWLNPVEKWAKNSNRYVFKEETQMASKHMATVSGSLARREMQIKTSEHSSQVTAVVFKDMERLECKMAQPLWKTAWQFLRCLKIESPHDLAIPLLDRYPLNENTCPRKNLTRSVLSSVPPNSPNVEMVQMSIH